VLYLRSGEVMSVTFAESTVEEAALEWG